MKTILSLILGSIAAFSLLTACGGGDDLGQPSTQAPSGDGSFIIFITKSGERPVPMPVKGTTQLTEVHAFAAQELGIGHADFDLQIAGKNVSGTIADLGFKAPPEPTPVPVGNIIAKMK
ncbi:MAG: hypothetical protein ACI9UA_006044 [Pseudoalteromonas tetraodonis]|jgi:hypothetical protein